jgi:hypothetical protein
LLGLVAQVIDPGSETKRRFGVHVGALLAERHETFDFGPLLADLSLQWLEESHQILDKVFAVSMVAADEAE